MRLARSLIACLLLLCGAQTLAADEAAHVEVRLLAFNDLHGYIDSGTLRLAATSGKTVEAAAGGAAWLATLIDELRRGQPTIVVGAGDMIGASPLVSSTFRHEPTIEALNLIGLQYTAVGNHEFDRGAAELRRLQQGGCHFSNENTCRGPARRFEGATFRYLAGNVTEGGKPIFPGTAIHTLSLAGGKSVRIGFIGLVTRSTGNILIAESAAGLEFEDEATAANRLARELAAQGVEAIVLLIHEGVTTSSDFDSCAQPRGNLLRILGKLDPEIDLVVSGHTHRAYVCEAPRRDAQPLLYTSAGSQGRFLTRIELTLDAQSGEVERVRADNLPVLHDPACCRASASVPRVAPDPRVKRLVAHYREGVAPVERRVVAHIDADITRDRDEREQSALGRLIADAQLEATRDAGAVVAFTNMGGIRADLLRDRSAHGEEPGEVTYGELFDVQPWGNRLVTLTLTGTQLVALLREQFRGSRASVLQASTGLTYATVARGRRGRTIVPDSVRIDGRAVEPDGRYRVTVNDYLAGGGDGFRTFAKASDSRTGPLDIDALVNFLHARHP